MVNHFIQMFFIFQRQRPASAGSSKSGSTRPGSGRKSAKDAGGLTAEERRIVAESKDEYQRRGGWMRVFPSAMSMERYGLVSNNCSRPYDMCFIETSLSKCFA